MSPKTIISRLEPMITLTVRVILKGSCSAAGACYCVYVVQDGEVVLYIGKTKQASTYTRMLGHIGQHSMIRKSQPGELFETNESEACHWHVELMTIGDCNSLLEECGGEHRVRKINTAEKVLIKLCRPCLNVMSNDDPMPLPKHCKRPGTWSADM